ncbi:MAG: hypothetical protein J07AB43_01860 [Candidatus Nanosalina sp. J07AB43]|jgi:hypothetical protein|nr:MAG: hypothetical protein J07AB43_01860 [Candidatus Nanosalina sp. J07AB43]
MSGKQVYIDEKYHKKLKLISIADDKDMKQLVEEQIEQMEPESVDELEQIVE